MGTNKRYKTFDSGPVRSFGTISSADVEISEEKRRLLAAIEAQLIKQHRSKRKR